jgi:hypothetical protein
MAEVDMAAARVAVATVPEAARDFGRRARSQVARPPKGTQRSTRVVRGVRVVYERV